jgi:hypothetical protein
MFGLDERIAASSAGTSIWIFSLSRFSLGYAMRPIRITSLR